MGAGAARGTTSTREATVEGRGWCSELGECAPPAARVMVWPERRAGHGRTTHRVEGEGAHVDAVLAHTPALREPRLWVAPSRGPVHEAAAAAVVRRPLDEHLATSHAVPQLVQRPEGAVARRRRVDAAAEREDALDKKSQSFPFDASDEDAPVVVELSEGTYARVDDTETESDAVPMADMTSESGATTSRMGWMVQ